MIWPPKRQGEFTSSRGHVHRRFWPRRFVHVCPCAGRRKPSRRDMASSRRAGPRSPSDACRRRSATRSAVSHAPWPKFRQGRQAGAGEPIGLTRSGADLQDNRTFTDDAGQEVPKTRLRDLSHAVAEVRQVRGNRRAPRLTGPGRRWWQCERVSSAARRTASGTAPGPGARWLSRRDPPQRGRGVPPASTSAIQSASILPPHRITPTSRPAMRSRSCMSAARGAAPAPSARLWVSA